MTFTVTELNEAVGAATESEGYEGYGNPLMDLYYDEISDLSTPFGKLIKFARGPENPGDGHAIYIIVQVEGDPRLFRAWGYYSSWDSSQIDGDLEEVESYEKVVIDYRTV